MQFYIGILRKRIFVNINLVQARASQICMETPELSVYLLIITLLEKP